ncbi:hypothetical protein [Roseateles sp. MS654]|uniref:hypothetical protein n=1 Tax=Roseateles sp. MS654 TaxID=3412685 RepID=UPI003C2DCC94
MPHLRFEASAFLASKLDWPSLTRQLHHDFAAEGWAALHELKSRVMVCSHDLAGDAPDAEQLVLTLITTNPRPESMRRAMTARALEHLERAVVATGPRHWVQCCVFMHTFDKGDYAKRQLNPPRTVPGAVPQSDPASPDTRPDTDPDTHQQTPLRSDP